MSEPFDLLERAPYSAYEEDEGEPGSAKFPSFSSLFLEPAEGTAPRSQSHIKELGDNTDREADDEDDGETITWITPRSTPRLHGLEALDDGFQLEMPASPMISSSSPNSGEESSSDQAFTDFMNPDHPSLIESDNDYDDLSDEEEYTEVEYIDNFSSGFSDTPSEEEDETINDALFKHEEKLGREFAYPGQDVDVSQFDTDYTIEEIVYGLSSPSETYVAVMRLFSGYVSLHEASNTDEARKCLSEIECTAMLVIMDWVYNFPEEKWEVGRARFALIGQLIRLGMALPSCMRDLIEDMERDLHVECRMLALSELFRYAGPRCATASNIDALEKIIGPACRERPDKFEMNWTYTKISKDMRLCICRNSYLGTKNDPIIKRSSAFSCFLLSSLIALSKAFNLHFRKELEEMVASVEKVEEEADLEIYASS